MLPSSCNGPNMKNEKNCAVIICPTCSWPLNISHNRVNIIHWRKKFTNVPCIKLMLRTFFTLVSSSPNILYVLALSLFTSWSVRPRLFTSSIFLNDSVVVPASCVVSFTIVFWIIFIFLVNRLISQPSTALPKKKIAIIRQFTTADHIHTNTIPITVVNNTFMKAIINFSLSVLTLVKIESVSPLRWSSKSW